MAESIGALIIELRANSAQFQAEMDGARKGLESVGKSGHAGGAGLSHFASIALRELVPGLSVSTREITTLIRTATTATGVLGTLAQAALLVGGAFAGYVAGNAIRSFVEELRSGKGLVESFHLATQSVKAYEEELKKAQEEQKKFIETIAATRAMVLGSARALAEAEGKGLVSAFKLGGNEPAAAKAQRDQALKDIGFEEQARRAALTKQFNDLKTDIALRGKLEAELTKTMNVQRTNAELDYQNALKKIREDAVKEQFSLWQKETDLLIGEYGKRLKLRQDFEQNLGQGGLGGGLTTTGLGQVGELQRKVEKDTRDLAGARRLGMVTDKEYFDALTEIQNRAFQEAQNLYDTWQAFPAVERAVTQAVQRMTSGFGTLGDAMQQADVWAKYTLDTNEQLAQKQAALLDQFTKIPLTTGAAGAAVKKLADDYNELAWQAAGATQQIYSAAAAMVYFHSVGG